MAEVSHNVSVQRLHQLFTINKATKEKNANFWTIHRSIMWNKFIYFCLLDRVFQIMFYQFVAWVIKGKAYSSYPQVSFLRSVTWYLGPTQLQLGYYISGCEWDWQCSGILERFQSKKKNYSPEIFSFSMEELHVWMNNQKLSCAINLLFIKYPRCISFS